ncbi:hypothetical protein HY745_06740 [Candidatus Desantisbacteria bacterium]|nr:hypothetical protein [Candidatus Desantisbacteria bacterium]
MKYIKVKKYIMSCSMLLIILFFINFSVFALSNQKTSELRILKNDIIKEIFNYQYNMFLFEQCGAIGINALYEQGKSAKKNIATQENLYIFIAKGIVDMNPKLIDDGLKALEYGLMHQLRDGEYRDSSWLETEKFIFSSIHALLLLKNSQFGSQYSQKIQVLLPRISSSLVYMKNKFYLKIFFNVSSGESFSSSVLASTAVCFKLWEILAGDNSMQLKSDELIIILVNNQRKDGVLPEGKDYDSYYQADTLLKLMIYYLYSDDSVLNNKISDSLTKGWAWQISRIKNDGSVNMLGNSLTGIRFSRNGFQYQGIDYYNISSALTYWGHITTDETVFPLARKVFTYGKISCINPSGSFSK